MSRHVYIRIAIAIVLGIAALICLATMNVSGLLLCGSMSAIMAQGARIAARRDREGR